MDCNIPDWNAYFMSIAAAVATRSKDPSTKVGAVLVNSNRHIIGTGYNGFPPNVVETPERWERPAKYQYVVHAEMNCILHSTKSARGASLYTTMYPCAECAKLIAASSIKEVFYSDDKYWNDTSALLLRESGVLIFKA